EERIRVIDEKRIVSLRSGDRCIGPGNACSNRRNPRQEARLTERYTVGELDRFDAIGFAWELRQIRIASVREKQAHHCVGAPRHVERREAVAFSARTCGRAIELPYAEFDARIWEIGELKRIRAVSRGLVVAVPA